MTKKEPANTVAKCPICNQPAAKKYHPFCSQRCADVDLGRWLKGSYAIPTDEAPTVITNEDEDY